MLNRKKHRRLGLALVAVLVAALFVARHMTERPPSSGPPGPSEELPTYLAGEAAEHVGRDARVCGRVVEATYVPDTRGRPTFLNFGRPYPDPVFTALIWGDDRQRFSSPPERAFRNRRICVRGRIQRHEGRPEIVVRRPDQIELMRREAPERR